MGLKCRFFRILFIHFLRLYPSENGKYWFICDPCGIICIFLTYLLVAYGEFVSLFIILLPQPSFIISVLWIIFTAASFLAIVSHMKAMCTDPGSMPRDTDSEESISERKDLGEAVSYCKKCRGSKPFRAHHCSTCNRCIQRMDHHCPWINNCVGAYNQKFFVLFCFYIMTVSAIGLVMCSIHFYECAASGFNQCNGLITGPPHLVMMVLAVLEALLFVLFTFIMFCSQVYAIAYDETGIERLKHEDVERDTTFCESMREVFGSKGSWHWLSPFYSQQGVHYRRKPYTTDNILDV